MSAVSALGDVQPDPGALGRADPHSGTERLPPRRRARRPRPAVDRLLADLARPVVVAEEQLAAIRAAEPVWPPPVRMFPASGPWGSTPVPLLRDGPMAVPGCARGLDRVVCVALRAPQVRCARCGAVTRVAVGVAGPQLPACGCSGDRPVCFHPPGAPRPWRRR